MWRNYLLIALRNLYKRRFYTSINMFGLTIGLACSALVVLFVRHELRYDEFHPRYQDIYRLINIYRDQSHNIINFLKWTDATAEEQHIKPNALKQIPEVEEVAQFNITHNLTMGNYPSFIRVERQRGTPEYFPERKILMTNTGKELLKIFGWHFIVGDASQACQNFYSAILTEQTAEKYFGKDWQQTILERTIQRRDHEYRITGVIETLPDYAHYDFDLILYTPSILTWGAYTYLRLHPDADLQKVNQKINEELVRVEPYIADDPYEGGSYLQPITDIHLHSNNRFEIKTPGDIRYIYIFSIIGVIILLITCTNYINLSVAMYAGRHQEIGMRKALGAYKSTIIGQFLTEAVLLSLLCLPLVLGLLYFILPFFNQLMNQELRNEFLTSLPLFALLLSIALLTGLLSGIYPALVLARKQTIRLFKEGMTGHGEGLFMRRTLIIFQFTLLIALSSVTFFINQQLTYIHSKNLGFEKEGVVAFLPFSLDTFNIIKNSLQSYPQIIEIGTGVLPGIATDKNITYQLDGTQEHFMDGNLWEIDYAAAKALGIQSNVLTQIEEENKDFTEVLLINEAAAKTLSAAAGGIRKDELVGMTVVTNLEYENESGEGKGSPFVITGFIEEIHLNSMRQKINPLFVRITKEPQHDEAFYAILKIDTRNLSETISLIENAFYEVIQDWPFEVTFLEEQLRKLYEQEQRVSILTIYLSGVAVILAILGLIGLTAYLTNLRIKEIGIRKVMGASVGQILLLLNREFILLVFIATAIATPIAYLAVDKWLSEFAYRINVNLLIFLLIGFMAFWVSIIVVTIQSIRAATANPVHTLRNDL